MSDSNKPGFLNGAKQAWKEPKARKGIILSAAVVVVVGGISYGMMGGDKKAAASVPSRVSLDRPAVVPQGDQMSPSSEKYKEMVREQDQKRAEEAVKTPGAMVLPKIAGLSDPNAKPTAGAQMTADAVRGDAQSQQIQANSGQKVQTPQEMARTSPSYASVMKLMTDQVVQSMAPEQGWSPIRPPVSTQTAQVNQGASGAAGTNISAQQGVAGQSYQKAQAPIQPLIQMGTTAFATLDTAINTDYSGPVVATIHEGKFAGAKVSGTKTLEFDAVVLKFTLLSPGFGQQALPINAYAITIDDTKKFGLTGIQGQTDRHIVQRWVAPAAAAFISGYGQAASQQKQSLVANNGGVAQATESLSSRDRMFSAVGVAVQPVVQDLQRMAARPITVSLDANREIGILFAADVLPTTSAGVSGNVQQVQGDVGLSQQQIYNQNQQLIMQQQAAVRQQQMQQQQNYGQISRVGYPYPNNNPAANGQIN
jgi:hypothetical protein